MFTFINRLAKGLAFVAILASCGLTPAFAANTPTIVVASLSPLQGGPGGYTGRTAWGTITMGAADTYVTGGFTLTASQFGFSNGFIAFSLVPVTPSNTITPVWSLATAGSVGITFQQPLQGVSNMTATATTKTVTVGGGLNLNSNCIVTLDDAATGGGGTGTWAVTNAVSTVKFASASSFTVTSIAAAPTNGGNFTWICPGTIQELPSASTLQQSQVFQFIAVGF